MKKYLPTHSIKTLVSTFVLSRLDYCNSLLAGLPDTQIKRLQIVQNRAARVVLGITRPDSTSTKDMLISLHWLPVRARIDYKIALFCFNALNSRSPDYITDLITPYAPIRHLRSSDSHLLKEPYTNLVNYGNRAFCKFGPLVWNSLPLSLRLAGSEIMFKKQLKTYLFTKYLLD